MPYTSLRPTPMGSRKPKNLGEFIARVQAERGFRNVTEESLKKEIEDRKNGVVEVKEEDTPMADANENEEDTPDANAARMEVLKSIESVSSASP